MAEKGRTLVFKISEKSDKASLGFVERSEEYLQKVLVDIRKDIVDEVGEFLPEHWRFVFKNMPVSLKQEQGIILQKCCVCQEETDGSYEFYLQEIPNGRKSVGKSPAAETKSPATATITSNATSRVHGDAFEKTTSQLNKELSILKDDLEMAKAKLESLQESPPPRAWHGTGNFTCTNCHFKGHKVSKPCRLQPCRGYQECGILTMHQEQKGAISKAKSEVKTLEKKVKEKKYEFDSLTLMKDRTKANFFSLMRPKVIACDPIKYSNRQTLENDLRVLAAALKHKVPEKEPIHIEDIIQRKKQECSQLKRGSSSFEDRVTSTKSERKRSRGDSNRSKTESSSQSQEQRINKQYKGYTWRQNLQRQQQTEQRSPRPYRHETSRRHTSQTASSRRDSSDIHYSHSIHVRNASRYTSTPNSSHNSSYSRSLVSPSASPIRTPRRQANYSFDLFDNNLFADTSVSTNDSYIGTREAAAVLANMMDKY